METISKFKSGILGKKHVIEQEEESNNNNNDDWQTRLHSV
ncbi:13865_t:CDS:2 [Rhizophagus irregularis]|nr:13865_t:CDS:2 [Rhizophagus irregularis]